MRNYLAQMARENLEKETGYDFSDLSDGEFVDGFSYDLFPNTHIWGGFTVKICYRIRPLGLDHERLTFNYAGRDFRLTDVYGDVVTGIVA